MAPRLSRGRPHVGPHKLCWNRCCEIHQLQGGLQACLVVVVVASLARQMSQNCGSLAHVQQTSRLFAKRQSFAIVCHTCRLLGFIVFCGLDAIRLNALETVFLRQNFTCYFVLSAKILQRVLGLTVIASFETDIVICFGEAIGC